MMVLITYDVNVETSEGKTRLRRVARECEKYGQRVQNSVFECVFDPCIFLELKNKLLNIINIERDSIRFYQLGNNWKNRVDHVGVKHGIDIDDSIVI